MLLFNSLNGTTCVSSCLGMPSSKTSPQPQHTECPRTTAQSWGSESAAHFRVQLPTIITEYIGRTLVHGLKGYLRSFNLDLFLCKTPVRLREGLFLQAWIVFFISFFLQFGNNGACGHCLFKPQDRHSAGQWASSLKYLIEQCWHSIGRQYEYHNIRQFLSKRARTGKSHHWFWIYFETASVKMSY